MQKSKNKELDKPMKGGEIPPTSAQQSLAQPKALYILFAVQMWEAFSYYGMRAILVLYMISELGFSDAKAFGIYAVSTALSESLGIFGGRMADRIFGLRYCIYLGGIIIALGHIVISIPIDLNGFNLYLALALISVGTGLLRTNCTALLGEFYEENDPRRDAGYTLFYVGLNIGAFLATMLCAFTAEKYGWHYGFSLAAFGMMLGLIGLFKFRYILGDKGKRPAHIRKRKIAFYTLMVALLSPLFAGVIYAYHISVYALAAAIAVMFYFVYRTAKRLPIEQKRNILSILLSIFLLAIFFGFEEQIGSTLVVFSERFSDKTLLGFQIPAASLTTINPLVILLLGPVVAMFLELYEAKKKKNVNIFSKISLAFLIQSVAFTVLYHVASSYEIVSANVVAISFGFIAFSELFIGPAVYSYCSELAPRHMRGVMMGTVMLGYSLANLFSGFLSRYMAIDESNQTLGISIYSQGFSHIMLVCIAASLLTYLIKYMRARNV